MERNIKVGIEEQKLLRLFYQLGIKVSFSNLEVLLVVIRNWKSATLLPLNLNWTPRYLLGCWTRLTLRVFASTTCSFIGMFGEQNTSDLARFID